jgi:hypothetical protein
MNILNKFRNELKERLKENPNDAEANIALARVFMAQGNIGKAANLARRVLAFYQTIKKPRNYWKLSVNKFLFFPHLHLKKARPACRVFY